MSSLVSFYQIAILLKLIRVDSVVCSQEPDYYVCEGIKASKGQPVFHQAARNAVLLCPPNASTVYFFIKRCVCFLKI